MSQALRLLMVTEYRTTYAAFSLLINFVDDLEIIEESANRENAVIKTLAYQPDILLFDPLLLKTIDSVIWQEIQTLAPKTQIWVLTENWYSYHYWVALAATHQYKSRKISSEQLLRAICTYKVNEAPVARRPDP